MCSTSLYVTKSHCLWEWEQDGSGLQSQHNCSWGRSSINSSSSWAGAAECRGCLHVISNSCLYGFVQDLQKSCPLRSQMVSLLQGPQTGASLACPAVWSFSSRNGHRLFPCPSSYQSTDMLCHGPWGMKCPLCGQIIGELWPCGERSVSSGDVCQCHGGLMWCAKPWQGNSVSLCSWLASLYPASFTTAAHVLKGPTAS